MRQPVRLSALRGRSVSRRRPAVRRCGPAVATLAVIGAVASSWLLTRGADDGLSVLEPEPAAVLGPVESVSVDYSTDAALVAELTEGPELSATGLAGTVTEVSMTEGGPVTAGQVLYRVGGVPVVAYGGETVLYRPLSSGTRGEDVALAQRLLNQLVDGSNLETDGVFGATTVDAVRAFERTWTSQPSGTFQPEWFSYLPTEEFLVASVEIRLGLPAPAAGEPVAVGSTTLSAAQLSSATDGPAGNYEFLVQGESIPVELGADGTWIITDIPAATTLALAQATPGEDRVSLSGRTRLVDGEPGLAVPASAVITDAGGGTCVAVADRDSPRDADIVAVAVVGSSIDGRAQLSATLEEGALVLVNPVQILGDLSCPSS